MEVILSPEPFKGEAITGSGLTVYRGRESGAVVGVFVAGIGRLTRDGSQR